MDIKIQIWIFYLTLHIADKISFPTSVQKETELSSSEKQAFEQARILRRKIVIELLLARIAKANEDACCIQQAISRLVPYQNNLELRSELSQQLKIIENKNIKLELIREIFRKILSGISPQGCSPIQRSLLDFLKQQALLIIMNTHDEVLGKHSEYESYQNDSSYIFFGSLPVILFKSENIKAHLSYNHSDFFCKLIDNWKDILAMLIEQSYQPKYQFNVDKVITILTPYLRVPDTIRRTLAAIEIPQPINTFREALTAL